MRQGSLRSDHLALALAAAALAVTVAAGCSGSSSPGGGGPDRTPPQPPVAALLTVWQRAPGSADGVSGAAGAVEARAEVVAHDTTADGAELGRVTAAADGSFAELPLGDNAHATIALLAVDAAGNVSTTATVVTNDVAAPETTLDPADATTTAEALQLSFSSSEGGTFLCALDGAAEAPCASPLYVTSLAVGSHALSVRAVDAAGNPDPSPAAHAWTVEPSWRDVSVASDDVLTRPFSVACGLVNDGRLYCWGTSAEGAVGANDLLPHPEPVLVGTAFAKVSHGGDHACAVRRDGTLWCWGNAEHGQVGQYAIPRVLHPADTTFGSDWTDVAAGYEYTCALKTSGALFCFGSGASGRLGDGSEDSHDDPQPVSTVNVTTGTRWIAVAASSQNACGLRDDGSLYCWGSNSSGQLAYTGGPYSTPIRMEGEWTRVSLSTGRIAGIRTDGAIYCRGLYANVPSIPSGGRMPRLGDETGWVGLAAGASHFCAWKADGIATCRGWNYEGELGAGNADESVVTNTLAFPVKRISAEHTSCAVTPAGELRCWGPNRSGTVGIGAPGSHRVPTEIAAGTPFDAVSAAGHQTCALSQGTRWCAGANGSGRLGDGTGDGRATLSEIDPGTVWSGVELALGYGLGLRGGNELYGWGSSSYSGTLPAATVLDPVLLGTAWRSAVAGYRHALAIRLDGTLDAWGTNSNGQLGDGTTTTRSTPAPVSGSSTWVAAAAGDGSSCAIRTDGSLWCWGSNGAGQLGNGTVGGSPALEPAMVGTLTQWTRIAARSASVCGIEAGELLCWGYPYGPTPVALAPGTPFDEVATGSRHACALSGGELYCWGANDLGQLGTGDIVARAAPTRVGTASDWTAVSVADDHTCGLRSGGSLWCWGSNEFGALGDGTGFYPSPQLVTLPAAP